MAEWEETFERANGLGSPKERIRILLDALDQADAANALDGSFDIRVAIVQTAYYSGDPLPALAAFARCRAMLAAHPDRFEHHRHSLDWAHKWMPVWAMEFPTVGADRLMAMVDELERVHVEAGSGNRQALHIRLQIRRATGLGPPPDELLVLWRTSARSSLSDCQACEILVEARALVSLGDHAGALAVVEPTVDGSVGFCGDGPEAICTVAIPLLIEVDRLDDAASMFRRGLRGARDEPRKLHHLAALASVAAAGGETDRARRLVTSKISSLDDVPSPHVEMKAAAGFSCVLAQAPAELDLGIPAEVPRMLGGAGAEGDTWRAGPLADALAAHARRLAGAFDARNGNSHVSDMVEVELTSPDVPPLSLFRVAPSAPPTAAGPQANHRSEVADRMADEESSTASGRSSTTADRVDRSRALLAQAQQAADPASALPLLREAVQSVRDLGPTVQLAEARSAMAGALRDSGRLDEATVQLAEAADVLESLGDLGGAARALAQRAAIEIQLDEWLRASDLVDDALLLLAGTDPADRTEAWCDVLQVGGDLDLERWNNERCVDRFTQVLRLVEPTGGPTAQIRSKMAVALGRMGETDRALALLDQADEELRRSGVDEGAPLARIADRRSLVLRDAGRHRDAATIAGDAVPIAEAAGDPKLALELRRRVSDALYVAWLGTWEPVDDEDEAPPTRERGDPAVRDEAMAATLEVLTHPEADETLDPYVRSYLQERLDALADPPA